VGGLAALVWCASAAYAQVPKIGEINVYGLHHLAPEKLLADVNLKPGDPLPPSKGDLEDRLEELKDVVQARVEAVCCEGGSAILFIGVEERGGPHTAFRTEPNGDATLPEDLLTTYRQFLQAVQKAAARGSATETFSAGHSFMDDPEARAFQDKFSEYAQANLENLRSVLRNGADESDRAAAATVIGYVSKKQDVVNDLQYALSDPDDAVRANAMRSLDAFAVLASREPQLGLKVAPTWFVELLHSVVLSDRVEATRALLILTDKGGQPVLDQLRERAVPDLVEMARWKTLRYALAPFLLVGRIGGFTDAQTQEYWQKNDRAPVIEKAQAAAQSSKHGK
jgi:hypothetical protein